MVSTLISPVTHVALVAVKNASTSGMPPAMMVISGMLNSQVPKPMSTTKLKMKMTAGCKWTRGSLDPGRIHSNSTATNKYPCTKKVLKSPMLGIRVAKPRPNGGAPKSTSPVPSTSNTNITNPSAHDSRKNVLGWKW